MTFDPVLFALWVLAAALLVPALIVQVLRRRQLKRRGDKEAAEAVFEPMGNIIAAFIVASIFLFACQCALWAYGWLAG